MKISFSYLEEQFKCSSDKNNPKLADLILEDIRKFLKTQDFTLGKKLQEFEENFANFINVKHAIGVSSGTDGLFLSLKAMGVGNGDEVITSAQTFIATAGAIAATGATLKFVDVNDEFIIDVNLIEEAITEKTKAIMPVYFTGNCPDMDKLLTIAKKYSLYVVEDSCCAIDANIDGKKAGSFGNAGAFSFHPLKNLNVWADGGMITTNSTDLSEKLKLLRNHGLKNRDEVEIFGYNKRLDTLQAVIALRMLDDVTEVTNKRINNAQLLDKGLSDLKEFVNIPKRKSNVREVFHLYMIKVKSRDELLKHLRLKGIDAKVHYPIALPYQECCKHLGYKIGDFPKTERDCSSILTLPCHQFLNESDMIYITDAIKDFYSHRSTDKNKGFLNEFAEK